MPHRCKKLISLILCLLLIFQQSGFAQTVSLNLANYLNQAPKPAIPDTFRPLHLRYISYDSQKNDFKLLLDKGDNKKEDLDNPAYIEENTQTLLKYFFIGLSLPNDKFWVNLRPDAPDNIIDDDLAKTDIGRIFLEADLQLKKDTAQFTSPQTPEGKAYWDKLYQKAGELFGTENITIPTLTRPWIVPGEIIIREAADNAYIYKATLKVMLEEDYLKSSQLPEPNYQPLTSSAVGGSAFGGNYNFSDPRLKELNQYSTQLIKETIIPKLTYEVNTSKRYAPLRQVYYSLILAQWFKQKYKGRFSESSNLFGRTVPDIDSGNLANLTSIQPYDKQTYFKQYQKSFAEGEYNLQEPVYTPMGQSVRRYMSGGEYLGSLMAGSSIITAKIPGKNNHEYLINPAAVSSAVDEKAKVLAGNILSPGTDKTLFLWKKNVTPKILKQTINHIKENENAENTEYLTQELIIRIIIETAGLKDESETSKNQRQLVSDIIHDAIDPSRTEQLENHIQDYLNRLKIIDKDGKEFYREDAKKIYNIAVMLEKSLIKESCYSLLLPIFTICRRLFGLSVYKITQEEIQTAADKDSFDAKGFSEEYMKQYGEEEENRLRKTREAQLKPWPKNGVKEITSIGGRKFNFTIPEEIINNFECQFKGNVLYIRNTKGSKKDVWIIFTDGVSGLRNVFYIDWVNKSDEFQMSDYEVITVDGKSMLIDRMSKVIFDMTGGEIPLGMLINYNAGVEQLFSVSPAAVSDITPQHIVSSSIVSPLRGAVAKYKKRVKKTLEDFENKLKDTNQQDISDLKDYYAQYNKNLLLTYYNFFNDIHNWLKSNGQEGIYIYPFMGADIIPKMAGAEVFSLNIDTEDFKRGSELLKHIFGSTHRLVKDIDLDSELFKRTLDAMNKDNYEVLKIEKRPKTLILKGFLEFAALHYGYSEQKILYILEHILTNVLQKGDRVIILTRMEFELFKRLTSAMQEMRFYTIISQPIDLKEVVGIGEDENLLPISLNASDKDSLRFLQMPNALMVLEKRGIIIPPGSLDSNIGDKKASPALDSESGSIDGLTKLPSTLNPDTKGGIAFNALPIQTEYIVSSALGSFPGTKAFQGDMDSEWIKIQQVFNAGIRPSVQRLVEFSAAAASSPMAEEKIDEVRGMLADMLRREEESEKLRPTEEALKQLLTQLESDKPARELQLASLKN